MHWGSRTPSSARRQHRNAAMVLRGDSPGVFRARAGAHGSPRNLGGPMVSAVEKPEGPPAKKGPGPQASGVRPPVGANGGTPPRYRRAKATKQSGRDHGESECLETTCEAGERPRDPVEGREAPGHGTAGGTGRSDTDPRSGLNATVADSVAPRTRYPDEPDASTRTSGSVGGLGGQPPRPTRQARLRWSFAADLSVMPSMQASTRAVRVGLHVTDNAAGSVESR